MNTRLNGLYLGIVITKDDPTKQGRVQIYIPSLDPVLSDAVHKGSASFVFPGNSNKGSLTMSELKQLRQTCGWAYMAQPVVGGGAMGRLEEKTGTVTASNSALSTAQANYKVNGISQGTVSTGGKYNGTFNKLLDAFADPSIHTMRHYNPAGNDFCPPNYTDAPNGLFSRPEVGAQVLVGFLGGHKSNAIILGKVPFTREISIIEDTNG